MRLAILIVAISLTNSLSARADRIVLVAGGGSGGEGPAKEAKLDGPFGIGSDKQGNLYFVEMTGQRVRKLDSRGNLTTIAGNGKKGSADDSDDPLKAEFNGMHSLAVSPDGDIYLADTWNNRVRKIDGKTGKISIFAGTGEKGFSGDDGPALQAKLGGIYCVALDPRGDRLYLADLDNRRIRWIDLGTGIVKTWAGNGEKGVPEDRTNAKSSPLVDPRAVAVDSSGRVWILERAGNALRVAGPGGKIRTAAGSGKAGLEGDGGDALKACFNGPKHICIDLDGNIVIADTENHVIRKYMREEGKIIRIAGTGKKGSAGLGGKPEEAELNSPHGVFVDRLGVLYIADSGNGRILRIEK
jgi:DNA-binding beta-propeller fold protein YncE